MTEEPENTSSQPPEQATADIAEAAVASQSGAPLTANPAVEDAAKAQASVETGDDFTAETQQIPESEKQAEGEVSLPTETQSAESETPKSELNDTQETEGTEKVTAETDSSEAGTSEKETTDAETIEMETTEAEPVESKIDTAITQDEYMDVPAPDKRDWYILKVQSNRETSIREGLLRRIKVEGLEDFFGEIIVPTEMVSEFKGGKKRVVKRKLYPGYIVVNMQITDDTWFLVRETPGIGDFTGSGGKPTPMLPHEVQRILSTKEAETEEAPKLKISFSQGDQVKITDGSFENYEGEVDSIDEASGRVTVMINIFGRSNPVELEYWQVESV